MEYLHCRILGKYIVPFCTTPLELGGKVRQIARQMAADMINGEILVDINVNFLTQNMVAITRFPGSLIGKELRMRTFG
ncbi:MAG: hypothetical protein RBT80_04165 [Candidatus Vecturithrix sp.]|jgi:hypothetical protein|nr:hypothetical protein [Candidatus Vecturithrix sp.]